MAMALVIRKKQEDEQPLGSGRPGQLLSLTQQLSYGRLSGQGQVDGLFGYQMNNTSLLLVDAGAYPVARTVAVGVRATG